MLPEGEKVRRAVRWISDTLKDSDAVDITKLVHKAIFQFDLNPKESENLLDFYKRAVQNQSFPL